MHEDQSEVPVGWCGCGCGERTNVARDTLLKYGIVRGQQMRFLRGHYRRKPGWPFVLGAAPTWLNADLGPCWLWLGCLNVGYAYVTIDGENELVHRHLYQVHVGPVPEGRELDHLCRVRRCVNYWHLEPVTRAVNLQRGAKTKLTFDQVVGIRATSPAITDEDLARMFPHVTQAWIARVRAGRSWANANAVH